MRRIKNVILLKLVAFFTMNKSQLPQNHTAIRREPGKHFSVTDSSKVCSIHFKDEHFKRSFGIGRLTYVEGAVPIHLICLEEKLT